MSQMSLREIKRFQAKDVTNAKHLPEKDTILAISIGKNGVSGCIYRGKDGKLYKITRGGSNLYIIV